jgi:hypothetical protein
LSDAFAIHNGLKHGDTLSSWLFNFALQHALRKVQENKRGFELNRTYHLLICVYDVNLLSKNINSIKGNAEAK